MFTGIIEEVGRIRSMVRGARSITIEVDAQKVTQGTRVGDSISTNGVCLTVTSLTPNGFTADIMPETLQRTSFEALQPGSRVNLERAMALGDRFGGHIVSGHIDGTGRVQSRRLDDNALWLTVRCDSQLLRYVVMKGSIAIQGVSLTVAKVDAQSFSVSLIPHTQGATTLHDLRIGDIVNLETDVIAKYTEKLVNR
ncbi:MAG: riboflavin synthase [Bacteroidales bacterium]|nr:riboflavin synthase [Candidatus Liminaster caballi]